MIFRTVSIDRVFTLFALAQLVAGQSRVETFAIFFQALGLTAIATPTLIPALSQIFALFLVAGSESVLILTADASAILITTLSYQIAFAVHFQALGPLAVAAFASGSWVRLSCTIHLNLRGCLNMVFQRVGR